MSVILVVDDQAPNREFLATLLGYYGHSVVEAGDGVEGLAAAASEHPDLIISDVLMPTMDGYEFVRRLRENPQLAVQPVVFYTAHYLEREALALAEKCGVSYVLAKPSEPEAVLDVVNTALGLAPQNGALPHGVATEHLELITTRLSRTADELGRANERLEALVEAGQRLATEREPQPLVDQYANVARRLVGSGMCVIGILDDLDGSWSHVAISGVSDQAMSEIQNRWKPDAGNANLDFCPPDHIGIAIRTSTSFFGWLCVAGKLGGGAFTEEDEKLARTLAAQLAVAYENVKLFASVSRHSEELERRVLARTRELQAAQHEMESFTHAVAHDLRTPLHHLAGFSSVLEERFGQNMDPKANDLVRRIQKTSCDMAELVKNLLELSRISKQEIQFEPVSLDTVLEEALREVRPEAGGRSIKWRIHSLPRAQGSPVLLKQVFVNLLSNAVKFTGRTADATIEVGKTIGPSPAVYIRDNGAGFDHRNAEQLFSVFQRLHSEADFPGTGAGLAIVQRIVNRHGGKIWAESAPGKGATFYFTLSG